MTDARQQPLTGKMFLYREPELLNREKHDGLGLKRLDEPFRFAAEARAIPLTVGEFAAAQKHYPVVFSELDNPVPLAVVGLNDGRNLFVGDDGHWAPGSYVPAYVRCYPFAVAHGDGDRFAVVIDRAAEAVVDNPDRPFFDGDNVTDTTQSFIDFCNKYDAERRRTLSFCDKLKTLGILTGQQATRADGAGDESVIATYVAVDADKFKSLDDETILDLHRSGALAAVHAHHFSLDNWQGLIDRGARN